MSTFEERMQKLMAEKEERESIRCPWCGAKKENDDQQYPVSYWGSEDGPASMECGSCEKEFFVKEVVSREYVVGKDEVSAA